MTRAPISLDTSALPDLAAFAAANGWSYEASGSPSPFGGAIFEYLQGAVVTDRFRTTQGPLIEVGTISGSIGGSQVRQSGSFTVTTSVSSSERRSYGYLAMQLERSLPQFVLDSTRNDRTFSTIPMPIAGGQQLSLEGDFDRYFRLYCPTGYERDALYVFTPDLMALLIDETGDFDVEIVDDMLFVYATRIDVSDAALWARFERILNVVHAKALDRTDQYEDDRAADTTGTTGTPGTPGTVAEGGRRLRMGVVGSRSSTSVILVVALVAFVVIFAGVGITVAVVLTGAFR